MGGVDAPAHDDLARFRAESQARLDALRPDHTIKGLFANTYFRLIEDLGGKPLAERARAAFGGGRVFDFVNYPYASLVRVGLSVADELAPRYGGVEPWLFEMGRLATVGFFESLLGRAFLAGFRPSPRTMLTGMPGAINSSFGFGLRAVRFEGESSCVFACREEFSPAASNAGAVHAAVIAAGARSVAIETRARSLFDYDLLVQWT